jgi:hypothetical protein
MLCLAVVTLPLVASVLELPKPRTALEKDAMMEMKIENMGKQVEMLSQQMDTMRKQMKNMGHQMEVEVGKRVQATLRQTMTVQNQTQAELGRMRKDLAQVQTQVARHCTGNHSDIHSKRQLQSQGPAAQEDFVRIIKVTIDMSSSDAHDGHRRVQNGGDISCDKAYVMQHTSAIQTECCDEPSEDCTGGTINTCSAGCGALILPLWTACQAELGPAAQVLAGVIDLCRATTSTATASAAGLMRCDST